MKRYFGGVILLASAVVAAAAPARPLHEPTPAPVVPTKRTFQIGDTILTVNDTLNQNDAVYQGKRHREYFVDIEAGKSYQIDMTSNNFDSYLYFENPGKQVVAQDDDGGGYPSARIVYKATESGRFRIIATHFGGGGNLGPFNIRVTLTSGQPIMNRKQP